MSLFMTEILKFRKEAKEANANKAGAAFNILNL